MKVLTEKKADKLKRNAAIYAEFKRLDTPPAMRTAIYRQLAKKYALSPVNIQAIIRSMRRAS